MASGRTDSQVQSGGDALSATVFGDGGSDVAPAIVAGMTLGRYAVLEVLGSGAMGTVIRAYDPKLHREVALKRLRTSTVDSTGIARMVREAQAMAQLSHPNVVAVYDVDVDERGVMLAMEYVPGTTLHAWMKAEHGWRAVVDVFRRAGQGLLAAHRAGIVHRDFKPANVLVADDGTIKVTDFGLAKSTSSSSNNPADLEGTGEEPISGFDVALTRADTVMGTPRYMAPEQHRGGDVGPAADQYAYCVALWEALCGAPPFDVSAKRQSAAKAAGPPAWPKTRPVPRAIADAVRRGLGPNPSDRFPGMAELLEALTYDPDRRRRIVLLCGGLAVLVAGSIGASAWLGDGPARCTGAEEELAAAWGETRQAAVAAAFERSTLPFAAAMHPRVVDRLTEYADEWARQRTEACAATTLRGEQSAEVMDLRIACLRSARAELEATVELIVEPDSRAIERAIEIVDGLPALTRCEDIEALRAEVPPPDDPAIAEKVREARDELARARSLDRAGRYADALALTESLDGRAEELGYAPLQVQVALTRSVALEHLSRYDEAEAELRPALGLALRWKMWRIAAWAAADLALLIGSRGARTEEGLWLADVALGLAQSVEPNGSAEAQAHNARGLVLENHGDYDAAADAYRTALAQYERSQGPDSLDVATARNNIGLVLRRLGKPTEAEAEFRAALALRRAALGEEHPHVATVHNNLGIVLGGQGRHAEAEDELRTALRLRERALGAEHSRVTEARMNLSNVLVEMGRTEEAEAELRRAITAWSRELGEDHANVALARSNLGLLLRAQNKHEEAGVEFRAALTALSAKLGDAHPDVSTVRANVAAGLRFQGHLADAEAVYRQVLRDREQTLGPKHPVVAQTLHELADLLREVGRHDESLELLERSHAIREEADVPPELRAVTAFALAREIVETGGDALRARELAQAARDGFADAGDVAKTELAEVDAWLAATR